MLEIKDIETGYGKKQVVFGLSLDVQQGEIVAIIGPNGAGKSTVLKTICGLVPAWNGQMRFEGKAIDDSRPAQNVTRGITFAPQGNRVFADLTVAENMEIGGYPLRREETKARIAEVLEMFPALKDRLQQKARTLSGGEQQMLALARTMIPKPKLLMLDEPSLGLAPNVVTALLKQITEIRDATGVSVLIVEQKVREVLGVCDRVYSMKLGRVSFAGKPDDLKSDKTKLRDLFL